MAETPKNNIEKRLSDYAEARRKAAGTPELHPATRRMLQSEVRQQFGAANSPTTRPSRSAWVRLWTRIAVTCGVAAAVAAVLVIVLPPDKQSQPFEMALMEKEVPAAAETLAPAPATSPKPASLAAPVEPNTTARNVTLGRMADSDPSRLAVEMESAGTAASAPPTFGYSAASEDVTARRVTRASGMKSADSMIISGGRKDDSERIREAKAGEMSHTRTGALAASVPAKPPASAAKDSPAVSAPVMAKTSVASGQEIAGQLLVNSSTQRFRNVAVMEKAKAEVTVLDEFVVQQNGNALKIVDRDGSVYDGFVQPAPADRTGTNWDYYATADKIAKGEARDEESVATVVSAAPAATLLAGRDAAPEPQQTGAQNLYFRVEGTNRSLRQRVVFTGNLIQNTFIEAGQNRFANTQTYRQQNQVQMPASQNQVQMQMQNNFINGRVLLNNNKTATEVNAVLVEP